MLKTLWQKIEIKLLLAWLAVILCTMVLDQNHSYLQAPAQILKFVSENIALLAIFALGAGIIIISGGIDLSSGSVIALSGSCFALLLRVFDPQGVEMNQVSGVTVAVTFTLTLLIGLGVGTLHAWLITRIGLPPFVATLATLVGLRSLSHMLQMRITNSARINIPNSVAEIFGNFWFMLGTLTVLSLALYLLMAKTYIGRQLHALGGNEQAARLSGIRVDLLKWLAYSIGSVTAALMGIIYACYVKSVTPQTDGLGYELNAIAASVIGGCSLQGGVGTIPGILLGCVFLKTLIDSIGRIIVTDATQLEGLVVGIVIVLAVTFSQKGAKPGTEKLLAGPLGWCAIPVLGVLAAIVFYLLSPSGVSFAWAASFGAIVTAILTTKAVLDRRSVRI